MAPGSLTEALNSGDSGGLRNKYYDYLSSTLEQPTADIGVDEGDAVFQGIVPTLAAAIFSKGGSFGFSGGPIADWIKQQEESKKAQAALDLETKTKRAALIGDELQRRDKVATDEWQQIRDEDLKRELAADSNDTKRDIAASNQSLRKDLANDREEHRDLSDTREIQKEFRKDLKDLKVKDQLAQATNIREIISNPQTSISDAQLPTMLVTLRGDVGNKAVAEQKSALPPTMQGEITKLDNWVSGGTQGTIPSQQKEAILALVNIYEKAAKQKIVSLRQEYKSIYGDKYSDLIDSLGSSSDGGLGGGGSGSASGPPVGTKANLKGGGTATWDGKGWKRD